MTWDLSGNIIYPSGIEAAKIVHWFPKHPLGTKLAAYFPIIYAANYSNLIIEGSSPYEWSPIYALMH